MTVFYTLYATSDIVDENGNSIAVKGQIKQSGSVPREELLPEKPEGYDFVFGVEGQPETERVENGFLVPWTMPLEYEALIGAVEMERKRRLAVGFDYDFKDERGVHRIGTTEQDEKGWDKVTKLASAYLMVGKPDAKILIVTDHGPVYVTAIEWQNVLIAAAEFQQPIFAKSFAIQAMQPSPQDVENPEYWK